MKDEHHEYLQDVINRVVEAHPAPVDIDARALADALPVLLAKIDELVALEIASGVAPIGIAAALLELLDGLRDATQALESPAVLSALDADRTVVLKRRTRGLH